MKCIEEIVHVIPLGHELDRAVKPFEKFKANRVHLLTITESKKYQDEMLDIQEHFLEAVKKKLSEKGIEVQCRNVNMFDLLEVMKNVSEVILKEKSKNNIVYVNMSACGRLTSVGATLAAMAHGARVYYVVADRYSRNDDEKMQHGLSICEKQETDIIILENFQLRLPDETGLKILSRLCGKEKGMRTEEILSFLRESGEEGFEEDYTKIISRGKRRETQQKYLVKLNKGILGKLESSGYITREKMGRYNTVKITDSGKYIAHIGGSLD